MIEVNKRRIRAWSMLGGCGTFGQIAAELAEGDDDFVVATADLTYFSGLERLQKAKPQAVVNFGIAEQNMIGAAAGMAKAGLKVFATTYASFASTRCLDQVKVCMGYMGLPVKLVGLTSGYAVGILGPTHMAMEDLAIMTAIPNVVVLSPADCTEAAKAIAAAYACDAPVYIRLTGEQNAPIVYREDYPFEIGKAIALTEGDEVAILATGSMVAESLAAEKQLREEGISCQVINVHTLKPLDTAMLSGLKRFKLVVTVEEHSKVGGLGSAVASFLAGEREKPPQVIVAAPDAYPHAASYRALLEACGLTSAAIAEKIVAHLAR